MSDSPIIATPYQRLSRWGQHLRVVFQGFAVQSLICFLPRRMILILLTSTAEVLSNFFILLQLYFEIPSTIFICICDQY